MGDLPAGRYTAVWNGRTGRTPVAAGLYFVLWESPGRSMTERVVWVR